MTTALIYQNSVESFYDGNIPPRIFLKNGGTVDGAAVGYSNENGYSILPVTFVDSGPPQASAYEDTSARAYAITGGAVQVTRTWVTPAAPVPDTITNAQARQWLNNNGLVSAVQAAIEAVGGNTLIKWEYANIIERSDPLVANLATQLGQTSEQTDQFFIVANAL